MQHYTENLRNMRYKLLFFILFFLLGVLSLGIPNPFGQIVSTFSVP
jgi:hypothetical protein